MTTDREVLAAMSLSLAREWPTDRPGVALLAPAMAEGLIANLDALGFEVVAKGKPFVPPPMPRCDYCDAGNVAVKGWHVLPDPEGFEGDARIWCPWE